MSCDILGLDFSSRGGQMFLAAFVLQPEKGRIKQDA